MIQLYCGDGKGKTTAAIGGAIRAAGAGRRVLFSQFMKGNETSELTILSQIPQIEILRSPENFGFYGQMTETEKKQLTEIHNHILKKILQKLQAAVMAENSQAMPEEGLFIVLDEITYASQWGLLNQGLLQSILASSGDNVEIVLTGRDPEKWLMKQADYVSEICCRVHPYTKGIQARIGVEY